MERKLENLCKYKKDKLKEHFEEVKALVKDARFILRNAAEFQMIKNFFVNLRTLVDFCS